MVIFAEAIVVLRVVIVEVQVRVFAVLLAGLAVREIRGAGLVVAEGLAKTIPLAVHRLVPHRSVREVSILIHLVFLYVPKARGTPRLLVVHRPDFPLGSWGFPSQGQLGQLVSNRRWLVHRHS